MTRFTYSSFTMWIGFYSSFLLQFASIHGKMILQGPTEGAQLVGQDVELNCSIMDPVLNKITDKPYVLTWTFQPHNMDAVSEVMTVTHLGGDRFQSQTPLPNKYPQYKSSNLKILHALLSDAGTYRCSSNLTTDNLESKLLIFDFPTCHTEKAEVYFREDISLECSLHYAGYKHPVVHWSYDYIKLNSTQEVENNSTLREKLIIEASEAVDGRSYHCMVRAPGMKATVQCLSWPPLQVYKPAKVQSILALPMKHKNSHLAGSNVTLRCNGAGKPQPLYAWSFTKTGSTKTEEMISDESEMIVYNLNPEKTGTYTCLVSNEIPVKLGQGHTPKDTVEIFEDSDVINLTIAEEAYGENAAYQIDDGDHIHSQALDTRLKFSPYAIGAVISASLAILLIIVLVLMSMKMKKKEKRMREKIARVHDENLDDQEVELLDESTQPNSEYLPTEYSRLKMSWEVPRKDVRLLEQVGQGAFVEVWKGRMRRSPGSPDVMRVIIKKIQGEATEKERHFFTAELEVLKMLPAHANVIRLVGSYTANEPWLMMMELASCGSLQQFLQCHRPGQQQVLLGRGGRSDRSGVAVHKQTLTSQKLLALAAQVASGLDHLEKFKLIYYRLRSCKVLVAKGGICKLSGFGFANEITERNVYESNSCPVRWAAPESLLNQVYNSKTDTWSYGILAWEIMHFGTTPYPTMGPHEVVESVQTGFRMPKPQHCSSDLYELLLRCWHTIPEERPGYQEILTILSQLVVNSDMHIDFCNLPDHLLSLDTLDTPAF